MANLNGFKPYRYKSGKAYNGEGQLYYKSATANTYIFVGDPVIRIASTDANGYPEMQRATTGSACTGHVVAIYRDKDNLTKANYLTATDVGYVLVCDDPDVLLQVYEAGSGTALAVAQIGKHIDACAAIDGNTSTNQSKYTIDNNAVASDNTYRIEGLVDEPNNSIAGAGTHWVVAVNLSTEVNKGSSNLSETA